MVTDPDDDPIVTIRQSDWTYMVTEYLRLERRLEGREKGRARRPNGRSRSGRRSGPQGGPES